MSSQTTLARPYAKAAFSLAREGQAGTGSLTHWQEMLTLASRYGTDEQIAGVLDNPLVSPAQAAKLLTELGGEGFDEGFRAFISVLAERRRLPLLPEILALFEKLKQEAEQRLQVRVVAARALDEDQVDRMSAALERRFNCAIELQSEIDPSVLGGAIIYAGDQVIDGSLRGRLNKLSNALAH